MIIHLTLLCSVAPQCPEDRVPIPYHLIKAREALVTRPVCSRPDSHSPHTPHIHSTLAHSCSHPLIHTWPASLAHTHPHSHTRSASGLLASVPALPLPRTPLPGSPRQLGHTASCRKPSLPALGQPHLPARVLCTLPLAAGPVRARSRCSFSIYLLLPTAGAAGRVCRALPAPGVKGDLSEGVGVSPGPAS